MEESKLALERRLQPAELDTLPVLDVTKEADASIRNQRVSIPFNLDNWRTLDPAVVNDLIWFHQHILDEGLTYEDAARAITYDKSVVFRILKGTYAGSWDNITRAIDKYRHDFRALRSKIQKVEFAENKNTRLICQALDYAVNSNTITLITGESGMSKSMTIRHWRDQNNSGRTILIEAPVLCNRLTLLAELCKAIGRKSKARRASDLFEHCEKALNKGRTLIVDEAHRLLPGGGGLPVCLEILRALHDHTKCGLAFVATARFGEDLKASEYQFEQLLGRIGLPCRLYRTLKAPDIEPLIDQYFQRATEKLVANALKIANAEPISLVIKNDHGQDTRHNIMLHGRLRALVEIFRFASLMSHKERAGVRSVSPADTSAKASAVRKMSESHFFDALVKRHSMMGEAAYAQH